MQKISPFLWFNDTAEEAANFYVSIFDDARIIDVSRYQEGGPGPAGSVMSVSFQLEGQEFLALNGGPEFTFSVAVSFFIHCENQDEVDRLWDVLTDGGSESRCGWLVDRYGLSWQVIPDRLGELLGGNDAEGAKRAMQAMMKMQKIDIKVLEDAYAGAGA
jgi:predicted 3-demethylubiquinone-9 3-methyltransferase (glyoxalase superfamily)